MKDNTNPCSIRGIYIQETFKQIKECTNRLAALSVSSEVVKSAFDTLLESYSPDMYVPTSEIVVSILK